MHKVWVWARRPHNLALLTAIGGAIAFLLKALFSPVPGAAPKPATIHNTVVVSPTISVATEQKEVVAAQPKPEGMPSTPDSNQRTESSPAHIDLTGTYILKVSAPLSIGEHTFEVVFIGSGPARSMAEIEASFWPGRRVAFDIARDSTDFSVDGVLYTMSVPKLVDGAAAVKIARRGKT